MELVRMFYNLMPQRMRWAERQREPAEFIIDETFGVPGVVRRPVLLRLGPRRNSGPRSHSSWRPGSAAHKPCLSCIADPCSSFSLCRAPWWQGR
jgi:hypothetical protein